MNIPDCVYLYMYVSVITYYFCFPRCPCENFIHVTRKLYNYSVSTANINECTDFAFILNHIMFAIVNIYYISFFGWTSHVIYCAWIQHTLWIY